MPRPGYQGEQPRRYESCLWSSAALLVSSDSEPHHAPEEEDGEARQDPFSGAREPG
jgi:hypothetical protein